MADNQTKDNIEQKRTKQRRRRRIRVLRFAFQFILLGLIGSAALFIGLGAYNIGSSIIGEFNNMYEGYNERKTSRQGSPNPRFDGYTNILILGLDEGAGDLEGNGQNADTIFVLSFSNETGKSRLLSIPRDTWIDMKSSGAGRLGNMYQLGGASMMVRQVSTLLKVPIHQYIIIDMGTFADLINVLGGLDIYVEQDMDYDDPESGLSIHLKQGYQHLDGDDAQKYLRFKGEKLGDVGRVQRQQKFIKALYEKVLQLETIPKLPAIADIFRNRLTTSAEIFDSAHLANVLRHMSSELPTTTMLPGTAEAEGVWMPDIAAIDAKVAEMFPDNQLLDVTTVVAGEEDD
ncbi:MAG: LCP family protein [Selenomonadaceae bacterium]|nr:LCP family protein [Selenomonadaceae bacterium]